MNFGLLLAFRNPLQWARPYNEIYAEHIDQAVFAEELGYDTIWTTEHHFAEDGWSPSLLPILSAIAARTTAIRIGTFIIRYASPKTRPRSTSFPTGDWSSVSGWGIG